jgi:serine phosphatase RsbU (regulator of sigma subunit)/pSer/pThr/pTyr-binding forkhead associated (FHA) protein
VPKLTIKNGLQKDTEVPLKAAMVIGRGAAADLSLPDAGVSRRHASLSLRESDWVLEDLNSANGTVVNGWRLQKPTALKDGDVIGVGSVFIEYSRQDPAPPPSSAPDVKIVDDGPQPSVLMAIPEELRRSSAVDDKARLRFMDDIARISTMVFDEQALVEFVVEEMLQLMPRADRAVVLIDQDGELVPRASKTRSGKTTQAVTSRRLLQDVMAKREAVLAVDTQADERYAQSHSIHALGIRAAICAPVLFEGEMYGVLQVDSASSGVPFTKADLALVMSLASQVGMALGYARLHARLVARQILEHDMVLAKKIQHQFMPEETLEVPGYRLAIEYRPALAIGGDFYDLIELGSGRIAIVIGDVSGKGISAALFAAKLATDLRYQAAGQSEPSEILRRANEVLVRRDNEGMFVTAAIGVLSPERGWLDIASAGHPPPYVRDPAGAVVPLGRAGDSPLGLNPTARYGQNRYQLEVGDTLVLYTDGVTEALDPQNRVYSEGRLVDTIGRGPGKAERLLRNIDADIAKFVNGAPQSDDVTILCLTRR